MKIKVIGVAVSAIALLASCSAHKKVPVFDGIVNENGVVTIPQEILNTPMPPADPVLQPGDLLNIDITASDAVAVAPFNKGRYLDADGHVQTISRANSNQIGQNALTSSTDYYLIDKDGNINFPILGEIHLAGLTKNQAQETIVNAIYPKYLKIKPVCDIRFMNFRVTMLGAVQKPGVITAPNERLNVFEAIALAGDLNIRADRERLILVRTNADGSREVHQLDVHDKNILLSPYYNLEPNDLIFVNYNRSGAQDAWQLNQGFTATMAVIGGISSVTALVISIINLTK